MTDEEAFATLAEMDRANTDFGRIIDAVQAVSVYNPAMRELADALKVATTATIFRDAVVNEVRLGATFFEALTKYQPKAADAVHDFIYSVAHPFSSVITKNGAREQAIKVLFGIV